jgi:hypothetical protein
MDGVKAVSRPQFVFAAPQNLSLTTGISLKIKGVAIFERSSGIFPRLTALQNSLPN